MELLLLVQWFLSDGTISLLEEQSLYSAMKMKSLSLLLLENDFTCCPNHIVLDMMVSWKRLFSNQIWWAEQGKKKTIMQRVKEQSEVCGGASAAQWEGVREGRDVRITNNI